MTEEKPKSRRNLLARPQERRLEDWISTQWDRVEAERPTRETFSIQATTAIGFHVSVGNISSAVKVIGKEWPTPKHANGDRGAGTKLRRMRVVVQQLKDLLADIGELPNPEFRAICEEMALLPGGTLPGSKAVSV